MSLGNLLYCLETWQNSRCGHGLASDSSHNEPLYVHNCEKLIGILLTYFWVYFHKRIRKKEELSGEKKMLKTFYKTQILFYRAEKHNSSKLYSMFCVWIFLVGLTWCKAGKRMVIVQLEFRGYFASIIFPEKQKKTIENLLCKWNVLLSEYLKKPLCLDSYFFLHCS